jgi:APA family basic amino acid/polyamine antiporter
MKIKTMKLFRTKSINEIIESSEKKSLKKTLGAFDLVLLGIGCVIGTGIFVLTGIGAAKYAGPGISLSYFFAAVACMFAALAYAELAAMVPVAGSAYTYSYAILGEFVAWLVGWALILEYAGAASTVASGWSGYMVGILKTGGIILPEYLTKVPSQGGIINLPAVLISLFIGVLLIIGTKESVNVNRVLVGIKLTAVFLFLIVAAPHVKMENWSNFLPFGWHGVMVGAGAIFFAYIGFDAVATTAEECRNPKRDLPIGIIGSLIICSILYIVVALVLTGITHYSELNNAEPLAYALRENGSNIGSALVATGAIAGMTTVLLVLMYGQSRVFFAMSRDGMIPEIFSRLHKRFVTPHISIIIVTAAVAITSGIIPIQTLSHLASVGTLFAFVVVAIGVLVLRIKRPELPRPFTCPLVFLVAPSAVIACSYLIYTILLENGKPFIIWSLIGLVVYFTYSYRNSPLNKSE